MADSKVTDLTALAETPNDSDLLHIVDVSDTTMAATGTNKKITVANALAGKQDAISGLTASGAELNILDGATLTTTELNYVDGVTSSIQTQLDTKAEAIDDLSDVVITTPANGEVLKYNGTNWVNGTDATGGGGSGLTEIVEDITPQLGGNLDLNAFTVGDATATDLTKLHALTATSTELNYVDGVTSAIQTQLDGKQPLDADLTALAAAGNSTVLAATTASFLTADETKLDGIEALADVTDATNVAAAGAVMEADTSTASMSFVIDEDDMSSDSATKVPTQQSVKAYVDAQAGGASAIDDLSDVTISTPGDGQVLTYDSGTSQWVNENSASGFSNPMDAEGDIIYGGASGAATKLAKGTDVCAIRRGGRDR